MGRTVDRYIREENLLRGTTYVVCARVGTKMKHVGRFSTLEEARNQRDAVLRPVEPVERSNSTYIYERKGRFQARAHSSETGTVYLGTFNTEKEAFQARAHFQETGTINLENVKNPRRQTIWRQNAVKKKTRYLTSPAETAPTNPEAFTIQDLFEPWEWGSSA
jgi:hypothetical protein